MLQPMFSFCRTLRACHAIMSSDWHPAVKYQMVRSYVRTFAFKAINSREQPVRIAKYQVYFCSFSSLDSLFHQIFVRQEYRFNADGGKLFIIDCGSNIGLSVLFFKAIYPNAMILAFEPDEAAFSCLERNVRVNRLEDVAIHNSALLDKEGPVTFYCNLQNPGSTRNSLLMARMPKAERTVNGTTLSKFINRQVDFLKMDVEGAEMLILKDLNATGKLALIKRLAIEYHHHIVENEDTLSQALRLLEDAGFGYQIEASMDRPFADHRFQDVMIYAYQKNTLADSPASLPLVIEPQEDTILRRVDRA